MLKSPLHETTCPCGDTNMEQVCALKDPGKRGGSAGGLVREGGMESEASFCLLFLLQPTC